MGRLVVLPSLRPVALDVFWLLVVYTRHGVAGHAVRMKQLVEFGLYGLSVAVFGALDQEGHEPNGG